MSRLVSQREHVVEHLRLVVHQDVRGAVERAAELNAPLCLPWFGIAIAPAGSVSPLCRVGSIRRRAVRANRSPAFTAWSQVCLLVEVAEDRDVRVVVVDIA